jgi:hypothetical protein
MRKRLKTASPAIVVATVAQLTAKWAGVANSVRQYRRDGVCNRLNDTCHAQRDQARVLVGTPDGYLGARGHLDYSAIDDVVVDEAVTAGQG